MGFVYILGDSDKEGYYKIGATRGSLEKRIKHLQTGNSGQLFLINSHKTKHPFMIENMLHKRIAEKRVLNEWYLLSDDEVRTFSSECTKIEDIISSLEDNDFFNKKLKD